MQASLKLLLANIILVAFAVPTPPKLKTKQVEFYEELNFRGLLWQGPPPLFSKCRNLPTRTQIKAQSLITNVCIMVYHVENCEENAFPSFSILPGKYPDLGEKKHRGHFQTALKSIRSFRECKWDEGGNSVHVELRMSNGEILAEYYNVVGCINIPSYSFGAVNKVNNHGSCVTLYDSVNCTGFPVYLEGGNSKGAEDLSDINFDGRTKSISVCYGA